MLKNLKLLRTKHKISQQTLAGIIGVSQQSINKYENHSSEPDINTLMQIADYFNTSVDFLIGHSDIEHKIEQLHPCDLNDNELIFLKKYRLLSDEEQRSIENITDLLLKK